MEINISDRIKEVCPQLCLAVLKGEVSNSPTTDVLWSEIQAETKRISSVYSIEEINKRPQIAATRKVYKVLGKDTNRYRPSAEALCRRIVRGIALYKVSALVDIINLVSIRSGISIGGFDLDKIEGDVTLGVGNSSDEFEAIGRGFLNVESLPLYRDNIGGIGTPTSDNERTKISENTTRILVILNGYDGAKGLQDTVNHAIQLLEEYAGMKKYELNFIP